MNIGYSIREFFWPLLEDEDEPQKIKEISLDELLINSDNIEKTLEFALSNFEAEESRRASVESKSSLFISTISVITTIIIAVTSILFKDSQSSGWLSCLIFLLFVLTVYMARTVWFSIKVLERRAYERISHDDFILSHEKDDYLKSIIVSVINKTQVNSITINEKVDYMTMAQEYYKRAIIVVSVYSLAIFFYSLSGLSFDVKPYIETTISTLNGVALSSWIIISLYVLIIASLIMQFVLYSRFKMNK